MTTRIIHGDCRDVLKTLPDASIDSIVTDPPYELAFMGRQWDNTGIAFDPEVWRQCLRVLKPGGHLLAFGGTRKFHRLACAIEDAGFELRDTAVRMHEGGEVTVQAEDCPWLMCWGFGGGFPKSHDVSKAIDKARGAVREQGVPGPYAGKRPREDVTAQRTYADGVGDAASALVSQPATPEAAQWQGWGTALKPAFEPIVVARKPLAGTVAANVLAHGTGGINIDGCRVPTHGPRPLLQEAAPRSSRGGAKILGKFAKEGSEVVGETTLGRWPENLLHDDSAAVLACFPTAPGAFASVGPQHGERASINTYGDYGPRPDMTPRGDTGSAARFFYSPKATRADRDDGLSHLPGRGNTHETVKPTELMRYLCRLVTPPGGTVLDPFMGSGSTLKAAEIEGFHGIGIDIRAECVEIARRRVGSDAPLFAEVTT